MKNTLFPDEVWNYKNFNMVVELDIAGEFIYDGMSALKQMSILSDESLLFSFLYHFSVGVERLQKIIIVLWDNVEENNIEEFEKSLITHSHMELNQRINKLTKSKTDSRENSFLQLITTFYHSARYNRFTYHSEKRKEKQMVRNFVEQYLAKDKIENHFITKELVITENVKELFGRTIGSISRKYYNLVREGCEKNHTFTYELRSGSKAEKVFRITDRKGSLNNQKNIEAISLKEFMIYLRNTQQKNNLLQFLDEILPLEYDPAFINEYVEELSRGVIPQQLIDETEYLYEINNYSKERLQTIDFFGNPNVIFDEFDDEE